MSSNYDRSPIAYPPSTNEKEELNDSSDIDEDVEFCSICKEALLSEDCIVINSRLVCRICGGKLNPKIVNNENTSKPNFGPSSIEHTSAIGGRNEFFNITVIYSVIVVAFISCFVYFSLFSSYSIFVLLQEVNNPVEIDCKNETYVFEHLKNNFKNKFPMQEKKTWIIFGSGILRIFYTNPTEPTSFLLYHDGGETVNCLVTEISKFASNCLTGTNNVIDVNSIELREEVSNDSGELITRYRDEILKRNVMVVRNLNDLPGTVVKEFHYFTDTYTPLVRKAVYFFTLRSEDAVVGGKGISKKVYKSFKTIWNETLDYSVLDPLIARMTTNIIPVIKEEHFEYDGC